MPALRLPLAALLLLPLAACGPSGDAAGPAETPAASQPGAAAADAATAPADRLDLNTATAEQLATIPGVGERMIHEFEEYRPYTSLRQFRREIGKYVDEAQVAAYEPYVYVPIVRNASDAETMQQLPGVDAAAAEALIGGRPYATNAAFLSAYAETIPGADTTAAARLLVPDGGSE